MVRELGCGPSGRISWRSSECLFIFRKSQSDAPSARTELIEELGLVAGIERALIRHWMEWNGMVSHGVSQVIASKVLEGSFRKPRMVARFGFMIVITGRHCI